MDDFRRRLGIAARLLPMSDDPVRTRLRTQEGWLDFQDYFVRRRCEPVIDKLGYAGAKTTHPHPDVLAALHDPRLRAVVICPSNPFISIDPILALRGLRAALRRCHAPVIAVSPIIGGKAVKGPTAKMMTELGLPVDAATVARHYADFLDLYIADEEDAAAVAGLDIPVVLARTLMQSLADREALARTVLAAADKVCK
jgi:LPPG:FO 2-phospho-L-lactate transferase